MDITYLNNHQYSYDSPYDLFLHYLQSTFYKKTTKASTAHLIKTDVIPEKIAGIITLLVDSSIYTIYFMLKQKALEMMNILFC